MFLSTVSLPCSLSLPCSAESIISSRLQLMYKNITLTSQNNNTPILYVMKNILLLI